ncbi:N-acetyltransferase [Vibrio ponticus]|uniref:N-acetyltransferase n=1 Tax=Vibrio ponticus TaxID=265668 RepID=A0A3N3DYM7_9VIBR|nr:GNAT family N-acetyltransferase [Vibrio ponticus]ROV59480.1 N-acetyltransferase [Vibrio ponticus]
MQLIPLSLQHTQQLLKFERDNQHWFEQHIQARASDFYCELGVQTHIAELLMDHTLGKALPMLIVDSRQNIIGRINLHNIHRGKAFLGYRLGEQYIGQGIAQLAVQKMLPLARDNHVQRLIAITSQQNIASQKVLTKIGFVAIRDLANFTQVQGTTLNCIEYRLELKSLSFGKQNCG